MKLKILDGSDNGNLGSLVELQSIEGGMVTMAALNLHPISKAWARTEAFRLLERKLRKQLVFVDSNSSLEVYDHDWMLKMKHVVDHET